MDIKEQFDFIAERYDEQRRSLIACFDDFYRLAVELMPCEGRSPRVLDIGCGTGLFSSFLMDRYPEGDYTLLDLSDKMLLQARGRFAGKANVRYVNDSCLTAAFDPSFDIIVSSLAIHHFAPEEKRRIYANACQWLVPGGVFVNADQMLSPSPEMERCIQRLNREKVERSGLPASAIALALERMKLDCPDTVRAQMQWLSEAGFRSVDCIYKYLHFAVLMAVK